MDVNGSRFHLLAGRDDWGGCRLDDGALTLAAEWAAQAHASDLPSRPEPPALEWDADQGLLRLALRTPLFRAPRGGAALTPAARRGAGRDHYGNWYWIDEAEGGLRMLPAGSRRAQLFWSPADAAPCAPEAGEGFVACPPPVPPARRLVGLAVTERHYLVVGDPLARGLLLFDLHGGGEPTLLRWPAGVPFAPWDIAATPDGGVLVLDRKHLTYWALDADFRLLAAVEDDAPALFQPADPGLARAAAPGRVHPLGYAIGVGLPIPPLDPISIEPGPDGTALIFDSAPDLRPYSLIFVYKDGHPLAAYTLQDAVQVADPERGDAAAVAFSVVGHDFASVRPAEGRGCGDAPGESRAGHTLYVAERGGNQAFAFTIAAEDWAGAASPPLLRPPARRDYLPLRRWAGRAIVAAGGQAYYDFGERWVALQSFVECFYEDRAVLVTSLAEPDLPGRPFDGLEPGCVWHRLLLDARIPAGTSVRVRARAADDALLLPQSGWRPQPDPYLRSGGAELAYYDPWQDRRDGPPEELVRAGTWELLFQGVVGRYIQIELTITGNGRATPALRALRAWYPRFSYLERYMPAIYHEEPTSAAFVERLLANFEGLYTSLEERIEHVASLFDPRTVPPEALDWLACWMGLALDPLWSEERRRLLIRCADTLFRARGTVDGVLMALRLYLDAEVDERLFDPARRTRSSLRIVESFRTRGAGALALGDPTGAAGPAADPLAPEVLAATAHRFKVLVPTVLDETGLAMVERIIELEKPAHTAFEINRYWDLFRVGMARLGLDTQLGESAKFVALLIGAAHLNETYLAAPYPFDIGDRIVSDRDRLGDMPEL